MHLRRSLFVAALVALGPAGALAQASDPIAAPPVLPTGGLRSSLPAEDSSTRYQTASQRGLDDTQILTEDELRRFAVPDDELVTGAVGGPGRAPSLDEVADPYAPTGIRRGPLTWFPALDLAVGYDSNIDGASNAREVATVRLSPEVRVESDWVRHAFTGEVAGSVEYVNDDRDLGYAVDADGTLRLDVGLDTTVALRGGYSLTGEPDTDANAAAGADGTTDTHDFSAGISVTQPIGPLEATLGLTGDRSIFADSTLSGGGTQSNADRNRTDITARLRLSQGVGPTVRPFGEASVGVRRFDEATDRNGFGRDSLRYGLRGGLIFSEDGLLRGELAVGVDGEVFDDNNLEDVLAISAAAGLTWDVTTLTSVTLDVATSLDPTTQSGSGVGINRSVDLDVAHALRRNVEVRFGVGVDDTRFSGINSDTRTYSARSGLTWRTSPVVAFRIDTEFEHESDAGGETNRFTAEAGITLRR